MSLFDLSPPRFGEPETKADRQRRLARARLETMHRKYGYGPAGAICGNCTQFARYQLSSTYFKCRLYGESKSSASDWRKGWEACGQFKAVVMAR